MGKWEEGLVEGIELNNSSKIKPNGKAWVVIGSSYEWEETHGSLCLKVSFYGSFFFFIEIALLYTHCIWKSIKKEV